MILGILDVDGFGDDATTFFILSIKMSPWVFGVFQGPFRKRTYHPVNDHISHPWKVWKMDINSKVPNGMGYVIVSRVG